MTEILNDGEQHHSIQGEVVQSCETSGRYGWTLTDMAEITQKYVTEANERYVSWAYD